MKKIKFRKKIDTGFTLIELLVVVAIIAVLAAMLLPALSKARTQAKILTCGNQLRNWGTFLVMYASENHDFFPSTGKTKGWWYSANYSQVEYGGFFHNAGPFVNLIYSKFVVSRELFYCPFEPYRSFSRYWPAGYESNGFSYGYVGSYGKDGIAAHRTTVGKCKTLSDPASGLMADQEGWSPALSWYWNHDPQIAGGFSLISSTANVLYTDGHVLLIPVWPAWRPYDESLALMN